MDLPSNLQTRLNDLVARHDEYSYNGSALSAKTLVCLIAPTAAGKSTLINTCLEICKEKGIDASEAGTTTTRDRRTGDDPANYITASEGITFELMLGAIERGELVNWSLFGTGHLYGTFPDNFPAQCNFLPTLPDSVAMLRRAGFKKIVTVYLAIPVNQWELQLLDRHNDPRFVGRMREAIESLEFAKQNLDDLIILSPLRGEEMLRQNAEGIIAYMQGQAALTSDIAAVRYIDEMLEYARGHINGSI
jgi:guanylate kinase